MSYVYNFIILILKFGKLIEEMRCGWALDAYESKSLQIHPDILHWKADERRTFIIFTKSFVMAENWLRSKGELQPFLPVVLSKSLWPLSSIFFYL